jgi:hypothetical protein
VVLERGSITFAGPCAGAAELYGSFSGRTADRPVI